MSVDQEARPELLQTPEPPYYVVVFTSVLAADPAGYEPMRTVMREAATKVDGYLGYESLRDERGFGISVSYWRDLEALDNWREHGKHVVARKLGRERWMEDYSVRVAKVERSSTRASDKARREQEAG